MLLVPRAGSGHGEERVGERELVHVCRAHQDRVRLADFRGDLIALEPGASPVRAG